MIYYQEVNKLNHKKLNQNGVGFSHEKMYI